MVGIFIDLFSIYKLPTTNITAANNIVNTALANWGTSFICLTDFKPSFRGENIMPGNLVPGCDGRGPTTIGDVEVSADESRSSTETSSY